jgi:deoxycytidine triphosphate deaminase
VREPAARKDVEADKDGWWGLHRGAYVITYREKVNLPTDLMALIRPRSNLLRSEGQLLQHVVEELDGRLLA